MTAMIAARPTLRYSVLDVEPLVDATQDQSSSKPQLIINNLRFDRPAPVRLLRNAFLVEDARATLTTRGFYAVPTALDRRGLTRLAPRVAVAGAPLDDLRVARARVEQERLGVGIGRDLVGEDLSHPLRRRRRPRRRYRRSGCGGRRRGHLRPGLGSSRPSAGAVLRTARATTDRTRSASDVRTTRAIPELAPTCTPRPCGAPAAGRAIPLCRRS